jgi:Domain of unknown function (DUF4406)/Domain of unknown function (DUF6378)
MSLGTVYLAGPMTGVPQFNFPAFFDAEHRLREMGWEVVNPAQMDYDLGFDPDTDKPQTNETYMRRDLPFLAACDAIALLPEWWTSKGAKDELAVARMCGLEVIDALDGEELFDYFGEWSDEQDPTPESPLLEALRIVHDDRGADYGSPIEDFTRTGRMWGAILDLEDDVTPREVALCLIGLKLSREAHQHKRDNLTDIAGYAETLAMLEGESA